MNEENLLMQKAFKSLESYTKKRKTENQIIIRFRQFHDRIKLTNLFLHWIESSKIGNIPSTSLSLRFSDY